jgi:hypothetical protein
MIVIRPSNVFGDEGLEKEDRKINKVLRGTGL